MPRNREEADLFFCSVTPLQKGETRTYCSKWNPIEHRLFPHLTGACRGVIFHTLETVRYYMAKAKTKKGLKVKVSILDKVYETGRKYAAGFKKTMKIVFDEFLPKWNYPAVPQSV